MYVIVGTVVSAIPFLGVYINLGVSSATTSHQCVLASYLVIVTLTVPDPVGWIEGYQVDTYDPARSGLCDPSYRQPPDKDVNAPAW